MSFSRWLDKVFRSAAPARRRDRRYLPTLETLEDRLAPAGITWVVGTLQDKGETDSLRYILDNYATAGDLVAFAGDLYSTATGNKPAVIDLQEYPAGLTGGPLVLPAGVNLVGPSPDMSRGYAQPLIEISGAQLSNVAKPFTDSLIEITGTNSGSWPDGIPASGNGFTQLDSPKDPTGDGDDGGSGSTVVANLAFTAAKANQAAVNFVGGAFSFLYICTVEANASAGIVNTGASHAYVTQCYVTGNGTGAAFAPQWGGIINQAGTQTTVAFSAITSNVATATNFGGGLTNEGGNLYIEDSTLFANTSKFGGGGVLSSAGNLILHSATIVLNSTGAKGGGIMLAAAPNFTITNTLDVGNIAQSGTPTYNDIYVSSGIGKVFTRFNLIGVSPPGLGFIWDLQNDTGDSPPKLDGTQFGTPGNPINLQTPNMLLGHLAPNGGPTLTIALLPGSRAIDAGDNLPADQPENYYSWDDSVNPPIAIGTDQRGDSDDAPDYTNFPRFYPVRQDIGAYEYQPLTPVTITPTSLPAAKPSTTFNQLLTGNGGNGNGYVFTGTGLPSWLSISTNLAHQGVLQGSVPAGFLSATFTVTATDSSGNSSGPQTYTITSGGLAITPAAGPLPVAIVGQAYPTQTITVSGGTGPYTITETGLPGWAIWTPNAAAGTATITGTPNATGSFTITVSVTDSASPANNASQVYTLTVNPALSLTPASGALPAVVEGQAYTAAFVAAGGTETGYTYSEVGTLPTGLTLNASTGQLTGTDTTAADIGKNFSFTVTVTDSGGNKVTNNYTVTVEGPIAVSPATLLPSFGTVNNAYVQTTPFTATGGSGTGYSFAVTSGSLPPGLIITASAPFELSGTPTAPGTFSFAITATDGAGGTSQPQPYTLTINPALTVSPTTLPLGVAGSTYTSTTLTPSGGSGTGYTLSEVGSLDGLTFNPATGTLSGTPTAPGTFSFTIDIKDSNNATGSQPFTLNVNAALTLSPPAGTLPTAAALGGPYSQTFTASGGSGSGYNYTEIGTLPAGLTFSNGVLSGTDNTAGNVTFSVQVTDSFNDTVTNTYTLVVEPAITFTPASLPLGTINETYVQGPTIQAGGGSGSNYVLTESGTIPGLTFSPGSGNAGLFSGIPTQAGTFTITINAIDGAGGTGSTTYNVTIDLALVLSPATLLSADVGSLYTATFSTTGGSSTGYKYTASGTMPAWLSISGNHLTGTPPVGANLTSPYSFSITVTDSAGGTSTNSYSLTVNPPLTLSTTSLPATAEGDAYFFPLTISGGAGGYSFTLTSATVPALTGIGPSGTVLAGVVTSVPGTYPVTITVTDSAGGTTTQGYNIVVAAPVSISNPVTLPTGTLGTAYPSTTFTATGGSGSPYTFTETGALPGGMTFNSTAGTLSGTPSTSGTFNIQVSATDGKSGTGTQNYSLVINFSLGTSAHAKFVQAVYEQLLAREPDAGAATWVQMLDSGAAPSTIVLDIERTTEYLSDVVNGLYVHYLGRSTAGDLGAVGWVNLLARGTSIESVTANIVASLEYYEKNGGSNTAFVKGIYTNILGRPADSGGLGYWVGVLDGGGSRYQVALALLTSAEYDTGLLNGATGGWNPSVPKLSPAGTHLTGYYPQLLQGPGDPAGLAYWMEQLQTGVSDQAVLAAMFGSPQGYDFWSVNG